MVLREEDAKVHGCSAGIVLTEARQGQVHADASLLIAVIGDFDKPADWAWTTRIETLPFDLDAEVEHILDHNGSSGGARGPS